MNSGCDDNELVIDLSKVNRALEYDCRETFQRAAFMEITAKLKELLESIYEMDDDITRQRRHDTIFIDGERGTGKTAFLVNIKKWIEESDKEASNNKKLKSGLAFFGPVDPTLLFDDENFLGVVLGTIVEQVERENDKNCKDANEYRQAYYKALEAVSESLRAVSDLEKKSVSGIDAIASHASSIMLEQKAHSFFGAVTKLLGKKALVLLIDDVDMAFDKGFDVLETIRKFLASPYIIPIVSGDAKLYKHLVKKEFKLLAEYRRETGNRPVKILEKDLQYMVDQYFNKVMPNDQRIELLSIKRLRKHYPILIKASNDKEVYYNQFKDFDIQLINYGINQVQFTSQVFPDNLRSFVQYLAKKSEMVKVIDKAKIETSKKSHTPYTPGSANEIIDNLYKNRFDLFLKSIRTTASFYKYSQDLNQKRLSLMLENDLNAVGSGESISPYAVFKGDFFQDDLYRKELGTELDYWGEESRKVFCKIKKEKLNTEIYFTKIGTGDKNLLAKFLRESECNTAKVVTRLFFYDSYYNQSSATRAYVVTGKFIEAIFYTLDLEDNNETAKKVLNRIANGRSYNIDIDANYIDDEVEEQEDEEIENERDISSSSDKVYPEEYFDNELLEKIKEVTSRHDGLYITTNKLHLILHKYFNNINALKNSKNLKKILSNDTPFSFMGRICAILLNSVAFFEKNGNVEESNIAMGKKKFSFSDLSKNSNAFRRNIQPLIKEQKKKQKYVDDKKSLTCILYEHPLIAFFRDETNEKRCFNNSFRLGKSSPLRRNVNVRTLRESAIRASGINTKNIDREKVIKYIQEIENKYNNELIKFVVENFDKRRTLESKIREAKIPEAEAFYIKYK